MSHSLRHEPLALDASLPRSLRASPPRMAHQMHHWLSKILNRTDWPDVVFAFHDRDEIGPRMLARLSKVTGLKPEDL